MLIKLRNEIIRMLLTNLKASMFITITLFLSFADEMDCIWLLKLKSVTKVQCEGNIRLQTFQDCASEVKEPL